MRRYLNLTILLIALSGCNALTSFDKPSGDAQILSAARACFDSGNYVCATQYYQKLSSSSADTQYSETALEILAQNGVTVTNFINIVIGSASNVGKLITQFANYLSYHADSTTRLAIFDAYKNSLKIKNAQTQGVVRFITSLALISEILSEDSGTVGNLLQTDIVLNPTSCIANSQNVQNLFGGCTAPSGKKIISGTAIASLSTATDTQMSGSPTLTMINAGINELNTAINLMGPNSKLGSSSTSFSSQVTTQNQTNPISTNTDSPAFRYILIKLGIGG